MYNSGIKESNVGFAKVDSRNGQCKIAINIKGVEQSNGKCEKVYLFYRQQEDILGIYIGSFQVINGTGEFHEQFQTQNIRGTNLALDEMNGIFVREEDRNERIFASGWDDYAIVVNRFCLHNNEEEQTLRASEVLEQKKEPIIFFDRNWKEEVDIIEQEETDIVEQEEIDIVEQIEVKAAEIIERTEEENEISNIEELNKRELDIEEIEELEEDITRKVQHIEDLSNDYRQQEDFGRGVKREQKMDVIQQDVIQVQSNKKEQTINTEKEDDFSSEVLDENQEQKTEFLQQVEGIETVIIESIDGERKVTNLHNKKEEIEMEKQQSVSDKQENGLLWGSHTPGEWKEMSWEEYQEKEQQLREQVQKCINQNREQQERNQSNQTPQKKKQQGMDMVGWIDPIQSEEWTGGTLEEQKKEKIELKGQMSEDMSKLEETIWDKLCHQFPKIRAFVDEPESLCLKIDLRDLRMLPQENWVLGSNSFLLHGYYNFRYLILTQQKGEFVLGIPGIYHPNEKMMASMFGFGGFKPVKACDKMLGQFGYWYKRVML